jgi:uncharacterized protein YndB with AHSA1/START domain
MIEPLKTSFEVACSAEHAFATWTSRISGWWPHDHTITGLSGLEVVLEPGVGGRIYERTPAGAEHEWGQVTAWEPPARLAYLWHLRGDRSQATDVEIRFIALAEHRTRVEIEHGGWDRLGDAGADWRDRNRNGWRTLVPYYTTAIQGARA